MYPVTTSKLANGSGVMVPILENITNDGHSHSNVATTSDKLTNIAIQAVVQENKH